MENVIGSRYGYLKVLAFSHAGKNYTKYYLCECTCGTRKAIRVDHLRDGTTKSCGCFGRRQSVLSNIRRKMKLSERRKNMLFSYFKGEAKRKKLSFTLTREECSILSKRLCFYCGANPKNTLRLYKPPGEVVLKYSGLDRVDNTKGYDLDNVVSCCEDCNKAKRSLTQEQFLNLVDRIYAKHNKA